MPRQYGVVGSVVSGTLLMRRTSFRGSPGPGTARPAGLPRYRSGRRLRPDAAPRVRRRVPGAELIDRRIAHTGLAGLVDRVGRYDYTFWARRC